MIVTVLTEQVQCKKKSVTPLRINLTEEFKEQVPNATDFTVG